MDITALKHTVANYEETRQQYEPARAALDALLLPLAAKIRDVMRKAPTSKESSYYWAQIEGSIQNMRTEGDLLRFEIEGNYFLGQVKAILDLNELADLDVNLQQEVNSLFEQQAVRLEEFQRERRRRIEELGFEYMRTHLKA